MPGGANRRLILAGGKQSKGTEQRQREREFHKRFRRHCMRCNSLSAR
jgi:hypothetical protein